jgi:superoxide dismutase, Cu-Zn family
MIVTRERAQAAPPAVKNSLTRLRLPVPVADPIGMRTLTFLLTIGVTVALAQDPPKPAKPKGGARAELKNAKGETVGNVRIMGQRGGEGVRVVGEVRGLQPGERGIHIHMTGKCEPPDFQSAGGHFNPTNASHSLNTKGGHAGDLGNLKVESDGTAKIDMTVPGVTMRGDGANSLFKEGGTALVIHAGTDDLKTDPAGNAGGRVVCGVITRQTANQ